MSETTDWAPPPLQAALSELADTAEFYRGDCPELAEVWAAIEAAKNATALGGAEVDDR